MNGFVFLTSPYLKRPNVLVSLEYHFARKRFIVDEMRFSQNVAICEGVHICDEELLEAVKKAIRKDCKIADIYFANEETQAFEEVV